jgi:hypothetical protein
MPDTEDLQALERAFRDAEADARSLLIGLDERRGTWRPRPDSWSVAECLDHLATSNRVYLQAMHPAAARALAAGRHRRGPARPGMVGGWFARSLEPPVKPLFRTKAPHGIRPRPSPPLTDAMERFLTSQQEIADFLHAYADIDLAGVSFPNPFIRGLRFSLATGLHVLAAHERRHLWQAQNVRAAAIDATSPA